MILVLIFALINAALAQRKGYNPGFWFLALGLIGTIVLAFFPNVTEKSALPETERLAKKKTANITGGVLTGVNIVLSVIAYFILYT